MSVRSQHSPENVSLWNRNARICSVSPTGSTKHGCPSRASGPLCAPFIEHHFLPRQYLTPLDLAGAVVLDRIQFFHLPARWPFIRLRYHEAQGPWSMHTPPQLPNTLLSFLHVTVNLDCQLNRTKNHLWSWGYGLD